MAKYHGSSGKSDLCLPADDSQTHSEAVEVVHQLLEAVSALGEALSPNCLGGGVRLKESLHDERGGYT